MGSSALAVLSAARRGSAPWAAAALLGLGVVTLITAPSCGNDAVGVDACRRIEQARCEAAAVCPAWVGSGDADERVKTCVEFYWDQCLHGIENDGTGGGHTAAEPTTAQVDACVAAVGEARACASAKIASMAECPAAPLAEGVDRAISPCEVITARAQALGACAFVATPNDGGSGTAGSGGGSGTAGSGGGSGTAGSGGGSGTAGSGSASNAGSGGDSAGSGGDSAGSGGDSAGSGGDSAGSGGA
ncbi:hypothetical protein WME90_19195 [Sorangium sp. So ce375]|uniref:hypothetical protein n=1 Tax=Sorangium sp. So ce375 TaxID=3133306 RepID=UPI003F5C957D